MIKQKKNYQIGDKVQFRKDSNMNCRDKGAIGIVLADQGDHPGTPQTEIGNHYGQAYVKFTNLNPYWVNKSELAFIGSSKK